MVSAAPPNQLARRELGGTRPQRWAHVAAVTARAEAIAAAVGSDSDALVEAAWLHDIGYAPRLVETRFHPLDGARFLRRERVNERVVSLVAYHSCARIEAKERGLGDALAAEFAPEESSTADALCYCDMTTGPDGQYVAVRDRLDEIRGRYGSDDVVTRFIERAEPDLIAAVKRTEALLAKAGAAYPM